jgi:hypothetical protein
MRNRSLWLAALTAFAVGVFAPAALAGSPTAIGVDTSGNSFVSDNNSGKVQRFNPAGTRTATWTFDAVAPLPGAVAIAVDSGNKVWVLDTKLKLRQFDANGVLQRGPYDVGPCDPAITPNALQRGGLAVTNTFIFVSHPCANKIVRFNNDATLTGATSWSTTYPPKGIAVGGPGSLLYVARPTHGDVAEYSFTGTAARVHQIGGLATDVFVDQYDVLHVSDATNDVIKLYGGSDCALFRTLGRPGANLGDLNDPEALDVYGQSGSDSNLYGNIFVADLGNHRIQRWNAFGYTFWAADTNGSGGSTGLTYSGSSTNTGCTGSGPPPPPPDTVGVTINNGAIATNSLNVTLTVHEKSGATGVKVSNDGGFGAGTQDFSLAGNDTYAWTLNTFGSGRATRVVYVRFPGSSDPDQTFSDDIIYDTTAPALAKVRSKASTEQTKVRTAAAGSSGSRLLVLDATDPHHGSGLAGIEVVKTKGDAPTKLAYAPKVTVSGVGDHPYVRVIDNAGNHSGWVRATTG